MKGAELRATRHQLGLTLMKFAPLLGIHWNTRDRFERGDINISEPLEILARLLPDLPVTREKTEMVEKRAAY